MPWPVKGVIFGARALLAGRGPEGEARGGSPGFGAGTSGGSMKTRTNAFGRGCFFVSLFALYFLVGLKAFLAWRDGGWPDWPLGGSLPDAVVRMIFSPETKSVRHVIIWLLSRDVVEWAAAICLVLWLLNLVGNDRGGRSDTKDVVAR